MAWSLAQRNKKLQEESGFPGTDAEFQEFLNGVLDAIPDPELKEAMRTYYRDPKPGYQDSYYYQRTMQGRRAVAMMVGALQNPRMLDLVTRVFRREVVRG